MQRDADAARRRVPNCGICCAPRLSCDATCRHAYDYECVLSARYTRICKLRHIRGRILPYIRLRLRIRGERRAARYGLWLCRWHIDHEYTVRVLCDYEYDYELFPRALRRRLHLRLLRRRLRRRLRLTRRRVGREARRRRGTARCGLLSSGFWLLASGSCPPLPPPPLPLASALCSLLAANR